MNKILTGILTALTWVVLIFGLSFVFMSGWNMVVVDVFHAPVLTYGQALVLVCLTQILK